MRIAVCVKQIAYVYCPIAAEIKEGGIDPDKLVYMLNPYDEIAVEQAVKTKAHLSECEVIVITAGPPRAEEALRYAHAFGADRMIRVDCDVFDPRLVTLVLGEVLGNLDCDLILCGKKAMDTNAGLVGSFLGEVLNIPQVTGIVGLELLEGAARARAEKYLGKGDRLVVECSLPALFTVENGLNDPRYPRLANRLSSQRQEVEVVDVDSLQTKLEGVRDSWKTARFTPPRPKPRKIFTPDSSLSAEERLALIMKSGSASKGEKELLEGEAEVLADKIVEFLRKNKVFSE